MKNKRKKVQKRKQDSKKFFKYIEKEDLLSLESIERLFTEGNFNKALKYIKDYVEIYPDDLKARYLLGHYLHLLNYLEEANSVFSDLLDKEENAINIKNILKELIYISLAEKNYEQAYFYYQKLIDCQVQNRKNWVSIDFSMERIFLLKQLGNYQSVLDRKEYNYLDRQVMEYRESEAIEYLIDFEKFESKKKIRFNKLDLISIYEMVKETLPIAQETIENSLFKTYIFLYPNIGYDERGPIDYMKVYALEEQGEYKIVEMQPYRLNSSVPEYVNDWKELSYNQREGQILKRSRKVSS